MRASALTMALSVLLILRTDFVSAASNGRLSGAQGLLQPAGSATLSDPASNAATCTDLSKCASSTTAASEPATGLARKVSTFARRLLSQLSPSDIFFDQSSLADDLMTSNSLAQAGTDADTLIADSSMVGGLRSPQTPSLLDEGSGMIWAGKGVAPIIRSSNSTSFAASLKTNRQVFSVQSAAHAPSGTTYMVVFQDAVSAAKIEQLCSTTDSNYGFECAQTFSKTFKGLSATTSQDKMQAFLTAVGGMVQYAREDEAVQLQKASIESLTVSSVGTTVSNGLWGLDRVDQQSRKRDYMYHYSSIGTGVHVYTVDTGINPEHEEFYDASGNSRVGTAYSFDTTEYNDCNGHGTHITGTMAGLNFGLAKDATIHSVRVMDCTGEGAMSTIITGLEWVLDNLQLPAVVLMSIGGDATLLLDQACEALVNAGATVVVAAGNDDEDACLISPARDASVITVAATTQDDVMPSFSDGGVCVDVLGPGYNILSAHYSTDTGTAVMSGTSMAAPHIAGIAALYLQNYPSAAPYEVRASVLSSATWGAVNPSDLFTDTPNAIGNSLLVDPLVTLNATSGLKYINITESNARSSMFITVALASQPTGVVTVSISNVDTTDRLSVPLGNRVLTFTSTNYAMPQPVVLTVVRNREAGWNQFELDFYVSAPKMTALDGSHHRMIVFDNRQVPGDTVDFPALITDIPFTGTGDTTNYADDYLIKTCTGASSTIETVGSPDYVYAFRPLTAVTVNASLCESAFDTKLILYKESSSSTSPALVSCNDDACDSQSWLQATLAADMTYYFIVDGFNGAYGIWQFSLAALDNSTVEGSLLSGPYGLAAVGYHATNTTSSSSVASIDPPRDPELVNAEWGVCECNQTMQDVSRNCQGQYNLLPMSECADTAATPLGYITCNGSCSSASTVHYLYEPWGSCSATCGNGTQTRTGACVTSVGLASTSCTNGTFSRECNSAPCAPTAWQVGAWGVCSKTCADKHGAGTQTRTVGCYQYTDSNSSVLVADSLCSGTKPTTTHACNGGTHCTFCSGDRARCNGHGICSNVRGACVCDTGYSGTFCNVPSSCEGVALADGACCFYELSKSGVCCEVVDKDMECCASGVLDAAGVCQGTAVSIDYNSAACTGALDATGACCDGVVDNFGVCNGYDASGVFQVALAEGSSVTLLASALGLSSSKIVSASEAAADLTSSVVSALTLQSSAGSATSRRLHQYRGAASAYVTNPGRQLQASLADEADAVARVTATTTTSSSNSSMVVYEVASGSATSKAITVATLTFGQAQLLLGDATALQDQILAIAAVAVCGNGVCELGERPNSTAAAVNATGGCPEDCHIPYVMCPTPSGSLSMCGGTPRGQCLTSSGQCSCNTGYSGVDCGSCALGYSRERMRCVSEDLQIKSSKWPWYWWLLIAVLADLVLATIVFASYVCWNGRRIAQERAAFTEDKLATSPAGAVSKRQGTGSQAPVHMTAAAGTGAAAVNPYYNKSFAPAPGLQQPIQSSYAYPGPTRR